MSFGPLLSAGLGILSSFGKGDPAKQEASYYPAFAGAADAIGQQANYLSGAQAPVYPGELTAPVFSPTMAGGAGIESLFYGGDPAALQAAQQLAAQAGQYQSGYQATNSMPYAGMTGMEAQGAAGLEGLAARALGPREMYGTESFAQQVPQYMDPYIQNVLDTQQDRLRRRMLEQRVSREGAAAQSGAFGGTRQAVQDSLAERDYNEQMAGLEADALSKAFNMARDQYNTGIAGNTAAEQQAIQLGMGAFQDIGRMGQGLGQRRMDAATLNERSRQAEEASRLASQSLGLQSAQQLGRLGESQQNLGMDRINAMLGLGSLQQDYAQNMMDRDMEQYLLQAGYPLDLIAQLKTVIGNPTNTTSTPAQAPMLNRLIGGAMSGYGFGNQMSNT